MLLNNKNNKAFLNNYNYLYRILKNIIEKNGKIFIETKKIYNDDIIKNNKNK